MEESQADLVGRAQRGDTDAFERLLLDHFDAAHAVALGVTGRRADAEDAVQDAFVRAWEHIDQCRDGRRFRAWLLQVVRRVALNRVTSGRNRRVVPLTPHLAASGPGPDRAADRAELRRELEAALRHLTATQRQALLLYDLQGLRHAEIGEALGISELMSRRHVSDARARMRELLAEYVSGERTISDA